jgi:aminopeptidase N
VTCWSRASGRDLAGWADTWLRSEGAPTLRAAFAAGPGPLAGPGARITFDERSWQALAAAALEVDDPVIEAVCWNAAWQLVTGARLLAASFADLVIRRLAYGQAGLPTAGAEVLLDRAVSCADVYAPTDRRAGLREQIADSTLAAVARARPGSPI